LKHRAKVNDYPGIQSPPARGRGLKPKVDALPEKPKSRPLRGGVD